MKIRPAETALFHSNRATHGRKDRQTDRQTHDEANSRFSHFCKTAWNYIFYRNVHTVFCIYLTYILAYLLHGAESFLRS